MADLMWLVPLPRLFLTIFGSATGVSGSEGNKDKDLPSQTLQEGSEHMQLGVPGSVDSLSLSVSLNTRLELLEAKCSPEVQ